MLKAGYLTIDGGALTDWASDCTAITGTLSIIAHYVAYGPDEIRIPPFVERKVVNLVSDGQIPGKAAYVAIGLENSATNDAFTVGGFGSMFLDCGGYQPVDNVAAHILGRCFQAEMKRGLTGGVQAEQADSDDDVNQRDFNRSAATATVAAPADLQPLLWSPPGSRISKLGAVVDATAIVRWTGTKTTATPVLVTRLVPQDPATVARMATEAAQELGMAARFKSIEPKTLSKRPYKGEMLAYMPWSAKFAS